MLGRNYSRFFSSANAVSLLDLQKAPSFLQLRDYSQRGKLRINQIDSLPRTGSTLLFRALAEDKNIPVSGNVTGAIFEPFLNRKKHLSPEEKLEHGASIILQRAKLLGIDQQPVTLVMKEIASYLPIQIMQHWQEIVNNFIFLMEDPHKQMYSFLHMLANGRSFGLKDAMGNPLLDSTNGVVMHSEENMRALWPEVTEMLAKNQFQQTAWGHLTKVVDLVTSHCNDSNEKKMVIVDGSILKLTPELTLSQLTKQLNDCAFTSAMTSSWNKTSGKLFFHPNAPGYDPVGSDGVTRSMWIEPALRATRFAPPAVSYPTDAFPPKLADHILHDALPAYRSLMSHPAFLMPENVSFLIEKGSTTCPVTLMALIKTLMDNHQTQEQYNELLRHHDRIMDECPEFSAAFAALSNRLEMREESITMHSRRR